MSHVSPHAAGAAPCRVSLTRLTHLRHQPPQSTVALLFSKNSVHRPWFIVFASLQSTCWRHRRRLYQRRSKGNAEAEGPGEGPLSDRARTPKEQHGGVSGRSGPKAGNSEKRGSWEYLFKRLAKDLARYTASPRRDFTYWSIVAVSASLAVASDFLGIMRWLLSFNPEGARQAGLDRIYEVGGLKSFVQPGKYSLRYPGTWLFDQSVAFLQQAERERPTFWERRAIIPDAAFGPPGGGLAPAAQTESLSVIVQPVQGSGGLEDILGEPQQAFQKLVSQALAPAGSSTSVELIGARQRSDGGGDAYEFEYSLTKGSGQARMAFRAWSTVALGQKLPNPASRALYTLTLVAPEVSLTPERRRIFEDSWHSFEVQPS
mmetsp:Transcript_123324/g.343448  ORF Transcript_123324/g.343448 Transcript_123324/m.343448 type:complete len:374 (+) Transcript_123324:42-1163(+)